MELYKKHRPKKLEDVVGQPGAIKTLQALIQRDRVPHAILLTGPSGCGKTTLARILARGLKCSRSDFQEKNCADFKGIDTARDVRRVCGLAPIAGPVRVWLIDEAHELTGAAQKAWLKMLEDCPDHVYFMLATTDPQKLIRMIHTRCTNITVNLLDELTLTNLVKEVAQKEDLAVSPEVAGAVARAAAGSARKALVILEQVGFLATEKEQLEAVQANDDENSEAIQLARALLNGASWQKVGPLLRELKEEPESLRWMVLGYCRSVLLGGSKLAPRAYAIIDVFSSNFYDSKHAGLAAACWEVLNG